MRSAPAVLFLLLALAWSATIRAEVRRCVMPGGNVVFTDRHCGSLGAVEQSRRHADTPVATRLYHGRCAGTLPDLLYEVTSAIDSRDVNRLAAAYHWPGMSGGAANATLDRLDTIATRSLLDVRIVTTDVPAVAPDDSFSADPAAVDEVRVVPTGLRLEQVLDDGRTPVTTHFSLRRHLDCWWVRL